MVYKAIGYNITIEEREIVRKMASMLTSMPIEIIDIKSFEVGGEIDPDDILLIYGQRAIRETGSINCRGKIIFPELYQLIKTQDENLPHREAAHTALLKFKQLLDSGQQENLYSADILETIPTTKISEESLPNLSADQVQTLEAILRNKGQAAWIGTTNDGQTIRLTFQPEESTADINMTFAELYCIRGLMEAFRVKELEIVYKPTTNSRESNSK